MAAVLEQQDAAAKHGSQVDEQIAQATSRIRTHDLMFGGLVLLALVLVYTTAMILLDKYLNLPQVVRQLSLLGFVAALGGTAYLTILSPLRKKINPLYAAKQVESTIDDAKNSVTGYVDAQQKGTLNATVKAALASRAAKSVAEADVNKAVDHRSLIWLGGVAVVLFLTLVVLFFVFRPAQFGSLMGRTFAPFTSTTIASRTQIELLKPDPAEPTITTGQSVTVAVHVKGKVPSAESPERVRLMIRHNPADPNYTELPMVKGDTTRDWELRVPDYLVQNGFWYKVAGGDTETPEYKVTVRSLPLFLDKEFQVTYEYPKYLRRKTETASDPQIKAYRGTTVTLVAATNRDVASGTMTIEPGNAQVPGTLVPGQPKNLQFQFKLVQGNKYKLTFITTEGERSADPFQSTITIDADQAPTLVINKPEDEESTAPTNGQLAIDGKVGDDFGIDTITLKMRVAGATARPLPDRPFLYGKSTSFRRAKDGTWPTDVDYKDSVDLATLKKDAAGIDLVLTPDMVIEYWLEATDNCSEPKPNVGRSAIKRLVLTPPKVQEEEKKNLDQQKDERKNEEKKHNADQQQKLDQEKRDQPKNGEQPKNDKGGEPKKDNGEGGPKKDNTEPMGGNPPMKEDGQPMKGEPKKDGNPMGGTGGMPGMPPDMGMPKGMNDPQSSPMGAMPPEGMGGMGQPNAAPAPKTPEEKDVERKAQDLQNAIEQENKSGGGAKPDATPKEEDRTNPAQSKPQPPMGDMGNKGDPQPKPKPDAQANPMKPDAAPASGKPEGNVEKPGDPSTPKPTDPKQANPMPGQKGAAPSEKRDEPLGGTPGTEKPEPKEPQPAPKGDKQPQQDPNSGSSAKPATQKEPEKQPGMPEGTEKKDPAANAGNTKPTPEQNRGGDKPSDPKAKPPTDATKPDGAKPDAGDAKPEKAPPAAQPKPAPKDDMMPGGGMADPKAKPEDGANKPMKPNGTGAAETKPSKPDDPKNPPMAGGGESVEKGEDKPQPMDGAKPQGGAGNNAPQPKKPTEKELKELEQAAKDLTSPDEKKKQEARDKLDKAVGQEKRKEVEKLANDLQSPDEKTREDAKRKLEEMKKQAQKDGKDGGGGTGEKKDAPKFDEKQMKEIADAMKDLQSGYEQKKKDAQQKLDKMIGENARKEAEQLAKDLQSPDKDTRDAAQKKIDDMKKELEKQTQAKKDGSDGKGKEPSKEEVEDLAKKAKDLQSPDQKTREKAEKELDEKLGRENREKLQEEGKKQKPGDPAQDQKLKEQVEQMAKEQAKKPHDPKGGGLGSSVPTKEAMEEDAKNRLKTAELRLEEFERKKYDEAFKKKQGFTDAEYNKFLEDYERYVQKLRDDAAKGVAANEKPPVAGAPEPGTAITGGAGGKVEGRPGTSSGIGGGTTVEAPGFEQLKDKFQKLLNEKKP